MIVRLYCTVVVEILRSWLVGIQNLDPRKIMALQREREGQRRRDVWLEIGGILSSTYQYSTVVLRHGREKNGH